ncbi:hypothetical protein pCXcHC2016_08 [Xenohaliotis phage pCXc-HC2016]|nr:hypothetical protein pCXcHC2016_08 [Xenohaliotis phage pCXc-HC2016]AQW89115.1 hypothetical protein pCXcHR2015_08 [Xenohaliotis phage pCXc-HR2015]
MNFFYDVVYMNSSLSSKYYKKNYALVKMEEPVSWIPYQGDGNLYCIVCNNYHAVCNNVICTTELRKNEILISRKKKANENLGTMIYSRIFVPIPEKKEEDYPDMEIPF